MRLISKGNNDSRICYENLGLEAFIMPRSCDGFCIIYFHIGHGVFMAIAMSLAVGR